MYAAVNHFTVSKIRDKIAVITRDVLHITPTEIICMLYHIDSHKRRQVDPLA